MAEDQPFLKKSPKARTSREPNVCGFIDAGLVYVSGADRDKTLEYVQERE